MEERFATCRFCDGGCSVKVTIDGDNRVFQPLDPSLPAMCGKVHIIDEYRLHPDRVTKPLKNVGKRGEPGWQEVSWDQALDEIAQRLLHVKDAYGPEAIAFAETPLNVGFGSISRRLMNHLGTPNYIAPISLCMGNTAQVHRACYGWLCFADWAHTDCVVYFGQHRDGQRWPAEYLKLKAALGRGAKLIVVDPRTTETAKLAHYHLKIRYGTDAALALAWLNVIIAENLYDAAFVAEQCVGFDQLREFVAAYTPEWAASVCGIDADVIRETARVYATAEYGTIPWGATGDMQKNSTSLLQAQCNLRAVCGFLNHGENVLGPAWGGINASWLADFDALPQEKRDLQLGADKHPLLSWRAAALYRQANERWGVPYDPDIMAGTHLCVPTALFAAMRGEGPYNVKAIVCSGNNTVMSYAGQAGIVEAFMNQELVVVYDHWLTPTAQLADYVLPADMWAERDVLGNDYDAGPGLAVSQAICEPVGECKDWYFVVKGLADRLGLGELFPWNDARELFDYRLAPLGLTYDQACAQLPKQPANKPVAMGSFVTPTGKVELASSVFEALGFPALIPYEEHVDPQADARDFPYIAFAGARERYSYNTNLHQIGSLRKHEPEPLVYLNPSDVAREGLRDGAWCRVRTAYGEGRFQVLADEAQPAGTLRVPHGWWKPEAEPGVAAGLSDAAIHNDGALFPDDDWNLDDLQGLPNLRGGIRAAVVPFD